MLVHAGKLLRIFKRFSPKLAISCWFVRRYRISIVKNYDTPLYNGGVPLYIKFHDLIAVLFYELSSRNGVDELRFEIYLSDADELTLYKVIYIYDV